MHAVRRIRWSAEPEMLAWVDAHCRGRRKYEVARDFAAEFGFWPARTQLDQARAWLGISDGPSPWDVEAHEVPVGTERVSKGRVMVKVAARPSRPLSKDNWVPKQRVVWEREHGPLPPGTRVYFADHDERNFDTDNLVAVPNRLAAQVSARSGMWHDRETLEAVVALCELGSAVLDARAARPMTCAVCGATYMPAAEQRYQEVRTCPACRAAGRKAPHERSAGRATCERCGCEFDRYVRNQRLCHECSTASRGRRAHG